VSYFDKSEREKAKPSDLQREWPVDLHVEPSPLLERTLASPVLTILVFEIGQLLTFAKGTRLSLSLPFGRDW
jgi:hypothetical protein